MPKHAGKTPSRKQTLRGFIFLGCFLTFIGAAFYHSYQQTILSFDAAPAIAAAQASSDHPRPPLPVSIDIPDVNIHLGIEEADIKNGVWRISQKQATHLVTSARPGETGNIVIYGHNKEVIFGSLPFVRVGARLTITSEDGTTHRYRIISKQTVNPDHVDLVAPADHEVLTLYTCTGLLDSQRTVLQATPE